MICPFKDVREGLHSGIVTRRRLNTIYADEESNYLTSCEDCFRETWVMYQSQWADSGQPYQFGDCPL